MNWDKIDNAFNALCRWIAMAVVMAIFIGMILVGAFSGILMTH